MTDTPEKPEAEAPAAPAADPAPEERLAALEAKLAELESALLYSRAETQNAARRGREEAEKARLFAVQSFAADMAEAAENLRRGLQALPAPAEDEPEIVAKLRGGFEGVERFLLQRLENHGVQRREAQGEPFDPEFHQAMGEAPAPEGVAPGTVLQAWSAAWMLNGRLLKPAMVVVAAGRAAEAPDVPTPAEGG